VRTSTAGPGNHPLSDRAQTVQTAAESSDPQLPATLNQAVRRQIGLTLLPPYEALITVAVNAALMSSAWFFLPAGLKDKVFTLHGTLAFALVLAAWMYSDVPATNVLGPDARRVIAAFDDPVMFRRLLYAKNVVLWMIVTPVCAIVAVIVGLHEHNLLATLYTIVWIGVVPFGILGISSWVGIVFPYHPMPCGDSRRSMACRRNCRIMTSGGECAGLCHRHCVLRRWSPGRRMVSPTTPSQVARLSWRSDTRIITDHRFLLECVPPA
jgi:hypothetical protein